MGNQQNVPQARRHQSDPIICCGQQPRRQPLDQASPNVMNVGKQSYGKFGQNNIGSDKNDENLHFQQTGSTYYKEKDVTIFRKPGNILQNSTYQNPRNNFNDNENMSKDSKQMNPLRPITQQQQTNKSGFGSFKKSTYGAFNQNRNNNASSNYGVHSVNSNLKQNMNINLKFDPKSHKPTPMIDFVGQKDIRKQLNLEKAKVQSPFIGQGKYGGRAQQFENNKRIVMFLQQNHIKEPQFKFYDTKDNSSLLNNSTILHAKKKYGKIQQKYLDQNSNSNLKVNQNLSVLQDPIELVFQIDAKIILATCLLIIAIVILVLGLTVFNHDMSFFICLIIAIILYVCYVLVCYMYNDVLQYLYNVRSFDQFQQDFKSLRETDGQLAYHIQLQEPKKITKQCYLLSKDNKYTKIQYLQNENRDTSIDELKDKQTSFVIIRYKTKTSFIDPESQFNTINYFDEFLEQHKNNANQLYGSSKQSNKQNSKRRQSEKQINKESKIYDQKQRNFRKYLKKSAFGYQINPIAGLTKQPQQVINVCYMEEQDNGCTLILFVVFTLLGLCLPFLCFFEAYTKRYRINLLNRFKVGEGK